MVTAMREDAVTTTPQDEKTMIRSVFLAGKISGADWRRSIVYGSTSLYDTPKVTPTSVCIECDQRHRCQLVQYSCDQTFGYQPVAGFPVLEKAILSTFDYVGPYYLGCAIHDSTDGCDCDLNGKHFNHGAPFGWMGSDILRWNQVAIARADLVFAWIDDVTAYATLYELGYAAALGKLIVIAGPKYVPDLAVVYHTSSMEFVRAASAFDGFRKALSHFFCKTWPGATVNLSDLSPIESRFLAAWERRNANDAPGHSVGLFPQYPLRGGKYRLDFAYSPKKIAIELDGLHAHSSTEQIANDRRRQREIEADGWRVIRFGGKEIHADVDACVNEVRDIMNRTEIVWDDEDSNPW